MSATPLYGRKVQVFRAELSANRVAERIPTFQGYFLGFGMDCEVNNASDSLINFPVIFVEDSTGRIHSIGVGLVEFLNPHSY